VRERDYENKWQAAVEREGTNMICSYLEDRERESDRQTNRQASRKTEREML
jgi:hypothetical protein